MDNQPLVSIIIPTYNRAHLIGETLDSVLAQTYQNWECIIVDDGSSDNTDEVLRTYEKKDPRFKYYHRPEEHLPGGNGARNYGFKMSRGEYVNWFDSDDLMLPEKLKIQVNDLSSGKFDFSVTQTELFDVNKNRSLGLRSEKLKTEGNLVDEFINFKTFWLLQSVLWCRMFLSENNLLLNEKLHQAQDYDFHLTVFQLHPIYIANSIVTARILIHENNMSISTTDTPKKILSNAYVQSRIIKDFGNDITQATIEKSFKSLTNYYRLSLRNRHKRNSILILSFLLKSLSFSIKSKGEKLLFKSNLIKGLVYLFLGKGYSTTKIFYE